jgi:glycosyltransferase involved in cell wall biosynthesis
MKLLIIVPAYNEQQAIGKVLDGLKQVKIDTLEKEIVVIDDGSSDNTRGEARSRGVTVLTHIVNRGLGSALGTGLIYANHSNADYVVTFDADGQHQSEDVKKVIAPLAKHKADVVIGSRMLTKGGMPVDRKIINLVANVVNYLLWSVWVTDTQSGLRAFSREAVRKIEIKMNKMEVSSEFLKEIGRHHLRVSEVPIKAIYTQYSKSKGQKNANAINVLVKLLVYKFANIK